MKCCHSQSTSRGKNTACGLAIIFSRKQPKGKVKLARGGSSQVTHCIRRGFNSQIVCSIQVLYYMQCTVTFTKSYNGKDRFLGIPMKRSRHVILSLWKLLLLLLFNVY